MLRESFMKATVSVWTLFTAFLLFRFWFIWRGLWVKVSLLVLVLGQVVRFRASPGWFSDDSGSCSSRPGWASSVSLWFSSSSEILFRELESRQMALRHFIHYLTETRDQRLLLELLRCLFPRPHSSVYTSTHVDSHLPTFTHLYPRRLTCTHVDPTYHLWNINSSSCVCPQSSGQDRGCGSKKYTPLEHTSSTHQNLPKVEVISCVSVTTVATV